MIRLDDGFVLSNQGICPMGGSSQLHCDIGLTGDPLEKSATIDVSMTKGGPVVVSKVVTLSPFNYCGDGIAQVIATTGDGGTPELSAVQYVNACGL